LAPVLRIQFAAVCKARRLDASRAFLYPIVESINALA